MVWSDVFSRRYLLKTHGANGLFYAGFWETRWESPERAIGEEVPHMKESRLRGSLQHETTLVRVYGCADMDPWIWLDPDDGQIVAATRRLPTAANSAEPWSISPNVRLRIAPHRLMPVRARANKVLYMTAGMIRSRYVNFLARDGSTRREAKARNMAIATNREGWGFACTAGSRILQSVHTSIESQSWTRFHRTQCDKESTGATAAVTTL